MIENKKVFILGMARSGYEVAKLLSRYNNDIVITDMKEQDSDNVKELKALNVEYIITDKPEQLLNNSYDYVIKNPGIRKDHKCVLMALELGIPVINETEVAYHFLPDNVNIIGITGSNGKTTTTTLIYEILKEAKLPVHLGGNIGYPLASLVEKVKNNDILVLEVSDHQLVDMYDFKTNISVLTNLSEVHIDFHGTYDAYKKMKKRIFNHHTNSDLAILNQNDRDVMELTKGIKDEKKYFSSKDISDCYIKDGIIFYEEERIIDIKNLKIKGIHNYENIMCAIMVVKEFHISNNTITKVLKEFRGVEHRIEFVKSINDRKFYNDAKSTNTESTITALKSFDNPIILLLGGLDRGHSFDPLDEYMHNVKKVICYGETKQRIKEWCDKLSISCTAVDNLKEATIKAYKNSIKGDIILLSPACASWDQFKDYEERGNKFKEVISLL